MDSDNSILLEITVPENASPLSTITVQAPDGRFFEIVLPDNVEPGNNITVMIPSNQLAESNAGSTVSPQAVTAENTQPTAESSSTNIPKVAAITAGVVLGTIVVGPIVTGIVVVGAVVASRNPPAENSFMHRVSTRAQEIDEENGISRTAKRVGHQTYNTVVEADKVLGVSATTSQIVIKAREIDEQNKISETVITSVHAGLDRIKEFDQEHHVSEQVAAAGAQAVQTARELDTKYEVTRTISTAFTYGANSISTLFTKATATGTANNTSSDTSLGHADEY